MENLSEGIQSEIYQYPPGSHRQVFVLAYPVVVTMISFTMTGLLNTIMIGRTGTAQLGAAGLGGTIGWTFLALFNGLISSANAFVAQDCGAGRYEDAGKTLWHYIYIAIASYIVVLGFSSFNGSVLKLIGPSAEVGTYSSDYIRIQLYFSIASFVSFSLVGFFRGIGDTKTPMYVTIAVNIFNIIASYLLIFGKFGLPRLEVTGIALATALSNLLSTALYLAICLSGRNNKKYSTRTFYRIEFGHIRRIIRLGLPMGVQFFLDNASFSVFTAFIARMGDVPLAASNAAMTLINTSFMPLFGISVAATTLVGQYLGANELKHARKSGYTAIKLGVLCAAFMMFIFFLFPKQLISSMSKDPEVIKLGTKLAILAGISRLSDGFGSCSGGALRGAGDTRFLMFIGFSYAWLLFIPLSYLLGYTFGGGAVGAWASGTLYFVLYGMTAFLRFRRGKWESIRI